MSEPFKLPRNIVRKISHNTFSTALSTLLPNPPSITPAILSLPTELILEIGDHIPDTHTLNNFIQSNRNIATILLRQLYYRAFNWGKKAPITSKFHSRNALGKHALRNGKSHLLLLLFDWYGLSIHNLVDSPDATNLLSSKGERFEGIRSPLHTAALKGHMSICKILLELPGTICSVHDTDEQMETPLHYAARSLYPEIAAFLIDNGADIGAVNKFGRTPLHVAIEMDSIEAVRVLLEKGANPLEKVRRKMTTIEGIDMGDQAMFSAMTLALRRQDSQDKGHLVNDSRLKLANREGVFLLLAQYEQKACGAARWNSVATKARAPTNARNKDQSRKAAGRCGVM